jgi:hypothetical protein
MQRKDKREIVTVDQAGLACRFGKEVPGHQQKNTR